ncbi:MAG: hypothetical protein IKT07_03735, partial [Oscillospiraceae bacterium]|nr:hypothetical protein [Oscillospiraceae bacterium]
ALVVERELPQKIAGFFCKAFKHTGIASIFIIVDSICFRKIFSCLLPGFTASRCGGGGGEGQSVQNARRERERQLELFIIMYNYHIYCE